MKIRNLLLIIFVGIVFLFMAINVTEKNRAADDKMRTYHALQEFERAQKR